MMRITIKKWLNCKLRKKYRFFDVLLIKSLVLKNFLNYYNFEDNDFQEMSERSLEELNLAL